MFVFISLLLQSILILTLVNFKVVATSIPNYSLDSNSNINNVGNNKNNDDSINAPFVDGAVFFHGGVIKEYNGNVQDITSPIIDSKTGSKTVIGRLAQMNENDITSILNSAKTAWNNGRGTWPQMSPNERIIALENVVRGLKEQRNKIIEVLMWEICKSSSDAAAEFDRTMLFIESTIAAFRSLDHSEGSWNIVGGILARIRRTAIGIMLCLGPFNYPFNETYATLIPALLTGNIIIMKIPNLGGLAHILTMEVYKSYLPPGTINFFSGSGRETMGPLMSTGDIDVLAFIGGSAAADAIIKAHPHPHRLKVFLQLEGKNLGVVMPDADIDTAVQQIVLGSTTYNGQRCTAIKLVMLHRSLVDSFLPKFKDAINALIWGLPWDQNVSITPLPEPKKPKYLQDLMQDAIIHGANVINSAEGGGELHGSLVRPAIVFPVTKNMRLWNEEQFGPVIPIAVYDDIEEVYSYLATTEYGQQAAVFTSNSHSSAAIVDILSTVVGRININTQCGRSPDSLPFSGRRSSALGTMSVSEALKVFSIETVIAAKHNEVNNNILYGYEQTSKFLAPLGTLTSNDDIKNDL